MKTTVRATYSNGAIVPIEPLDIEEGTSLSVIIDVESRASRAERGLNALKATAGRWKGAHDPEELIRDIYESRLAGSRQAEGD